jgi:hypothetical protein
VADDYFDGVMVHRQRLLWAIATRQQLERWEPLVASVIRLNLYDSLVPDGVTVWTAQMEHHFALIAARNLFKALDLDPPMDLSVEIRSGQKSRRRPGHSSGMSPEVVADTSVVIDHELGCS